MTPDNLLGNTGAQNRAWASQPLPGLRNLSWAALGSAGPVRPAAITHGRHTVQQSQVRFPNHTNTGGSSSGHRLQALGKAMPVKPRACWVPRHLTHVRPPRPRQGLPLPPGSPFPCGKAETGTEGGSVLPSLSPAALCSLPASQALPLAPTHLKQPRIRAGVGARLFMASLRFLGSDHLPSTQSQMPGVGWSWWCLIS